MYIYVRIIRKSTSINNCVKCFFTNEEIPNLLITKNNTIEIYDLTKEGLQNNKNLNIYGNIHLLLSIPSYNEEIEIHKDNIFVLTELLDYCVLTYYQETQKVMTLFSDSIKLDLGIRQENILYSLDVDKNFLLISAYKNIFKLICLNTKMRLKENYNDFIIKYPYEDILFLSNFTINNIRTNSNDNLLTFAMIKLDKYNQNLTEENSEENNSNNKKHQMTLETFQIKVEPKSFNIYYYEKKQELKSKNKNISLKITSNRGAGYNPNISNTHEKMLENFNFLQKINISQNPTVSLMITHPEGIIFLFFSNYAMYYKYDNVKKELIPQIDKRVSYTDRKFINYAIIDEKNYKYFISDEFGNLFLMALIVNYDSYTQNEQFILQILGEINYSKCLVYLDNNYLFNGSNKGNSQLIKIETNTNSLIKIEKNYESLSPIKDFILINNIEEENAIEFLTISGFEKNCAIKKIKKGSPVIFKGGMNIKNLKDVFKVDINNKENIYTLIITTISKSFVLDYNNETNEIFINNKLMLDNNELVIFVQNSKNFIVIVTNIKIKILNKNFEIISDNYIEETNKGIIPLIAKFNKKLNVLFIYTNKQNLISFKFDNDGNIKEKEEILSQVSICDFDICKYFIVYALWDSNNLYIYSFNSKKIETINIPDESLDSTKISSIQIFKYNSFHYLFISLSTGKLIYFQLKQNDINYDELYTFSSNDFIFKRKYNLNKEDFTIKKIKQKNNNSLFINTQTPLFIHFQKTNLVISYFNIKSCKNLIEINEDQFLFLFKDKINFGTLIQIQSQNIISKYFQKQINVIKLISFGEINNNKEEINKSNDYILTIEENKIGNKFRNSLILNDINLKEISRYDLPYENEQSNTISEIEFKNHINAIESKLLVIGTSIIENISKEPIKGHLYLLDIKQNNNYKFSKLFEIETNGGIHKVISCDDIIYVAIGNILYIYQIKQFFDNSYEIKLIKKYSDFTLIKDIQILNESKIKYTENNSNNSSSNNIINITNNDQYIIISDIGRSICIYCFNTKENKFSELYRDNNNTWVLNTLQINDEAFYISDIEGNIISLRKNTLTKDEGDILKLERIAYYNVGEKINSMILTKIKNKDLLNISPKNIDFENDEKIDIIFFVTLEGTLGQIIQINKETFMFLKALQDSLIKKNENIGDFDFNNWKKFRYGIINKNAQGFIEGDLIEKFLNNDDNYKKQILKELNYNWNKQYDDIIHILETLVNNH